MTLDLTDEKAAALLRELDGIIANDRYFLSPRITILKAIRAKIRPEPAHGPLPPPKAYAPPASHSDPEAPRLDAKRNQRRDHLNAGKLILSAGLLGILRRAQTD
jgi:hypothetical protein